MAGKPLWRDNYKSDWCVACTGDKATAGVWAHWERRDGLTLCGEFHKPDDYPMSVTIEHVKEAWVQERRDRVAEAAADAAKKLAIKWPDPVAPPLTFTLRRVL